MAENYSIRAAAIHHKQRHAADGPDPITPDDIGATSQSDFVDQVSGEIDYGGNPLPFGPDAGVKAGMVIGMAFDQSIPAAETAQYFKQGVGSPEGVVAATRGAIYLDRSGGGGIYQMPNAYANTGWVKIAPTPDTGWREITSLSVPGVIGEGIIRLRRTGDRVTLRLMTLTPASNNSTYTHIFDSANPLPAGFRPEVYNFGMVTRQNSTVTGFGLTVWQARTTIVGQTYPTPVARWNTTEPLSGDVTFLTHEAWPTTLPGTPA